MATTQSDSVSRRRAVGRGGEVVQQLRRRCRRRPTRVGVSEPGTRSHGSAVTSTAVTWVPPISSTGIGSSASRRLRSAMWPPARSRTAGRLPVPHRCGGSSTRPSRRPPRRRSCSGRSRRRVARSSPAASGEPEQVAHVGPGRPAPVRRRVIAGLVLGDVGRPERGAAEEVWIVEPVQRPARLLSVGRDQQRHGAVGDRNPVCVRPSPPTTGRSAHRSVSVVPEQLVDQLGQLVGVPQQGRVADRTAELACVEGDVGVERRPGRPRTGSSSVAAPSASMTTSRIRSWFHCERACWS